MIAVSKAKSLIDENISYFGIEEKELGNALGYFLAEDVLSPIHVPSFDNSAMDGYAISGLENHHDWELKHSIAAGDNQMIELQDGEAARIFTGAMLPKGAQAIVIQEDAVFEEGKLTSQTPIITGQHIRKTGEQCREGDPLLKRNSQLTVGSIALLASCGVSKVKVYKKPKVGVIVTGDELTPLGQPLEQGKIYDSNRWFLSAYLKKLGIEEVDFAHAKDDKESLTVAIGKMLGKVEVLILTGGVSVGEHDHVKDALKANKVIELFHKVKQKPGKPIFVGKKDNKWAFGLPGNPASVALCFNQYVKPCLMQAIGNQQAWLPSLSAKLDVDFSKKLGLTHFLKVRHEAGIAHVLKGQESFNLISFAAMTHFALIPEASDFLPKNTEIELYEW